MSQEFKQAEEIAKKLAKEVSDIDVILVYGGIAQGRFDKYSDYDMIAISDKKWVAWEFILDNQPICLWPMTWKKAEEVATGKTGYWSVAAAAIFESKVVWQKSDKMLKKFEDLKKFVSEGGPRTLKKAIADYDRLYGKLWRMQKAIEQKNELDISFLKNDIVNELAHILSALNNRFYLNNFGKQLSEIETFEHIPNDFIENYRKFLIAEPEESLVIGSTIVEEVKILVRNWLNEQKLDPNENAIGIAKEWPGIIEWLNKTLSANEKGDLIGGLMAATANAEYYLWAFLLLQNKKWLRNGFYSTEEELLKLSKNIPDNIKTLLQSQNLEEIKNAAQQLTVILEEELKLRGATLPIADSLDNAKQFIQQKEL
ncbi:MAG: nucleotidyltransferase domain-containing protein [Candidatus Heimdallarchaeota archaeon]